MEEGANLVFQHVIYNGHCDGNGDDWFSYMLNFVIDSSSTSFALKDSALSTAQCFDYHNSTWLSDYYPVLKGNIEGRQLSKDEWKINGSVNFTIPLFYP